MVATGPTTAIGPSPGRNKVVRPLNKPAIAPKTVPFRTPFPKPSTVRFSKNSLSGLSISSGILSWVATKMLSIEKPASRRDFKAFSVVWLSLNTPIARVCNAKAIVFSSFIVYCFYLMGLTPFLALSPNCKSEM